jgi:hypothetical protein
MFSICRELHWSAPQGTGLHISRKQQQQQLNHVLMCGDSLAGCGGQAPSMVAKTHYGRSMHTAIMSSVWQQSQELQLQQDNMFSPQLQQCLWENMCRTLPAAWKQLVTLSVPAFAAQRC